MYVFCESHPMLRPGSTYLLIGSLFCCSGCGSNEVKLYPVSGKVTGGTGSLEGVRVLFTPVDPKGLAASGSIGADGSYSLESTDGRTGGAAGKYKISFT